jgi:hypothetical protein
MTVRNARVPDASPVSLESECRSVHGFRSGAVSLSADPLRAERKNFRSMIRFNISLRLLPIALLAAALTGCGRGEDVKVYRVSKEPPPEQVQAPAADTQSMPAGHPEAPTAQPKVSWTLPDGWQEIGPGKMSVASFLIRGSDGKEAQVAITPLGNLAGKEAMIINMWRMQAGLPELPPDKVEEQLTPVQVGPDSGKMFEVTGTSSDTNRPIRIITAMAHRPFASWFYKLAGDADLVEAQKPAFISFLKSIKIDEAPAGAPAEMVSAPPAAPASAQQSSGWKTPADWKTVEPGPMQAAKFSVEKGAAKADVTVSIFPNSTGGALMNVNRWRGQIGLPPIADSELGTVATPLDEKIPDSILADMSNGSSRLVGAIVPRGGQWYFYKLRGDADAVAAQKEAFVKFARSEP